MAKARKKGSPSSARVEPKPLGVDRTDAALAAIATATRRFARMLRDAAGHDLLSKAAETVALTMGRAGALDYAVPITDAERVWLNEVSGAKPGSIEEVQPGQVWLKDPLEKTPELIEDLEPVGALRLLRRIVVGREWSKSGAADALERIIAILEGSAFARLKRSIEQFRARLRVLTIAHDAGARRVDGIVGAMALNEATDELMRQVAAAHASISGFHGRPGKGEPPAVLMESDALGGPFTPVPSREVAWSVVPIGGDGAPALVLAALDGIGVAAGFPLEKWNALQAANPGANHRRWRVGDVIDSETIDRIDNALGALELALPGASAQDTIDARRVEPKPIPSNPPALSLDLAARVVRFKGKEVTLPNREATILERLIKTNGNWVSGRELRAHPSKDDRPDRVVKKLRDMLPGTIESVTGKGTRLLVSAGTT